VVITNTFWPSLSQQVCFSIACALWHCVAQQFRVVQGYGVLLFSRLRSRRSCSEDKECQQHLKNATRFFLAQKTGCGTSGCNDQIIRKPQNDIRRKCFLWWKCFLWTSCYIKRMALIYFAKRVVWQFREATIDIFKPSFGWVDRIYCAAFVSFPSFHLKLRSHCPMKGQVFSPSSGHRPLLVVIVMQNYRPKVYARL